VLLVFGRFEHEPQHAIRKSFTGALIVLDGWHVRRGGRTWKEKGNANET
jgi:hypothetical protein